MNMILQIAWRNIWRNPVRSFVIILSVILGLWAGTFVSALYWGMSEDRVRIAIENEVSHLQIHHPEFKNDLKASFCFSSDNIIRNKLQNQKEIKAYSLRALAQGMLTNPGNSTGVLINGVDPKEEDLTTHLKSKITEGSYFKNDKKNQILIGYKLAEKLKIRVKNKVVLSCLDTSDNISSAAFKVAGIYRSGNSARDEMNVFILRNELNEMLNLNEKAHEAAILLKSNRDLNIVKNKLQPLLNNLKIETWKEISPETDLIISTMSQFSTIFIIIILFALSFGIVNTMLMAILERTREIGMIIALGMNRTKVFFLILVETFILVMIGCPVGLFIAWISIEYFGNRGIDISSFASKAMSNFGFSTVMYPSLPFNSYLQIILLIIIAAIISAIFPAIKALKLNPAETLKS
jgi:putative ABC transport system permease protein